MTDDTITVPPTDPKSEDVPTLPDGHVGTGGAPTTDPAGTKPGS